MSCVCCRGCLSHVLTYSYTNANLPGVNNDSEPRGKHFDQCPVFGYCEPFPFGITQQPPDRSCCGGTIDGFIRSNEFSPCCKVPVATVFAGSRIDDYGEIAGVKTAETCGILNVITTTFTTTPEIVTADSGAIYLKIPVKVTNSPPLCGPYGLAGVTVRWGFLDHTTCSQHSAPV
jgi:hypothetical protein